MSRPFPLYTEAHANCGKCELRDACNNGKIATAYQPPEGTDFNGIMIVGEGPGHHEVIQGRPFVGPSGRLLRAILDSLGAKLDECYLTNATLCRPPNTSADDKRSFMQKFPHAVHSCLPRLELEITAVRPRVILALGAQALAALTGYEEHYTKLLPARPCLTCKGGARLENGTELPRKVVGIQCSKGDCKHRILLPPQFEGRKVKGLDLPDILPADCPKCGATLQRLTVRQVPCPTCGGLKRIETPMVDFRWDYQLGEVAGAVIDASKHGWDSCGVRYVIATYHPSFLLRPPPSSGTGEDKAMGGQYAVPCVQKHIAKALRLRTADADWSTGYEVTDGDDHAEAAAHLLDYVYGDPSVNEFTCDIESEGWGTQFACSVCETKAEIFVARHHTTVAPEPHHCVTCTAANDKLRAEAGLMPGLPVSTKHIPLEKELDARKISEVSKIKIVGFASRKRGHALVTDTRKLDPDNEADPLYQAFVKVFTDPNLKLCFHHGNYDAPALYKLWGIEVTNYTDDTLILHHDLYPDEKHSLSHVAFEFTDVHAWKPPKKLHGKLAHESFEAECAYNARDTMLTEDSLQQMKLKLAPKRLERVYAIDMQLQRQAFEMWKNGMYVDRDNAVRIGQEAVDREVRIQAEMRDLLKWPEFNPRSAGQMAEALYDRFGYACSKMTDGGARSTAKEVVLQLRDSPFKRLVLDHKEALATLANYFDVTDGIARPGRAMRIWSDNRLRVSWKAFGTRTGRFSSSPNCFDGETEVLTPDGWVRFDAIDPAVHMSVAQYAPDSGITFVKPTQWIKKRHTGAMHDLSTRSIRLRVTGDHRCLLRHRKTGELRVFKGSAYPEDWQQIHAAESPNHGTVELPQAQVVLLCAIQADATMRHQQVSLVFDKERKKERLQEALDRHCVPYTRTDTRRNGRLRTAFKFKKADIEDILIWLDIQTLKGRADKRAFSWRLLDLDPETRGHFVHELSHWDGHFYTNNDHGAFTYSSSVRQNVDVAQALICMHGFRSKVREYAPQTPRSKVNYQLDVVTSDCSMTTNREHSTVPWAGYVYCVSVPSSYIVVRREGRIHITGQCQNWKPWLKALVTAPPGRKIVGADYDQLELRILAALSGDKVLIDKCMNADENDKLNPDKDPHSYVAFYAFGKLYTDLDKDDPAHDKKNERCKCQKCERKALRDICKRVIYGMNYGAGDETVLDAIYSGGYNGPPLSLDLIGRVRKAIYTAFSEIGPYQKRLYDNAVKDEAIYSPLLGRRRIFPLGDVPFTEILNFPIQSGGADIMNQRNLLFEREVRSIDPTAMYIAQVHDAVYYEVDEQRAPKVSERMTEILTWDTAMYEGGPVMHFSAQASIGDTWKGAA